ncbi:MAG: methyltransferase, partial [Isosphaeraceae bacterium]|nr:methyltransferase [Isosphaeraceae bacterium]
MPDSSSSPRDQIARKIIGFWISQMIYVAARLGLADLLASGPRSAEDLAQATGTHAPSLYRLLRALASEGIFAETEGGRFEQTPLSECLRADVPGSRKAMALMMGEEHFRCWGELLECIRTGRTAFERLYGQPIFDYLAEHPEQARLFDAAMTSIHGPETAAMLDAYDFSGIRVLADVGGGNGSTLIEVLRRHPDLHGLLFDLPGVVERARPALEAAGVAAHRRVVRGRVVE